MQKETLKYIINLRKKENKTNEEIAFLEMYKTLFNISEVLVDESKWHLTSKQAIEKIKENLDNINYI